VDIHTYISLYTGAGGLDVGFRTNNPKAIPLLYVERDFEAAAVLVEKIRTGRLDKAPIWSDTGTIDCRPFVGRVDTIIAGFPCQPFSQAGKRKGTEDKRWLWHHIKRLASEIRCKELFLENVAGLFMGGIQTVIGELSEMGYDAKWLTLSAADIGSPHQRERVFILARKRELPYINTMANTDDDGKTAPVRYDSSVDRSDVYVGTTKNKKNTRPYKFPPAYNSKRWLQVIRQNKKFTPTIPYKSGIRGVADGLGSELARRTKLKILGNGVVPQQAAVAYNVLKEEL
jgi:DNA-cytosine methyltransferase